MSSNMPSDLEIWPQTYIIIVIIPNLDELKIYLKEF